MSLFSDVLDADSRLVFLNEDEFAAPVELDHRSVLAVRSERAATADEYQPDLPARTVVLHVATCDVDAELAMGGSVMLDGQLCTVASRRDSGGMTRLELARNGW